MQALVGPIALQPAIIDVVEVVFGGVNGSRRVYHVEVPGLGRAENVEASDGLLVRPERRQRSLDTSGGDDGADTEEAVVRRIPLTHPRLDIGGQRHRVVQIRDRRNLADAQEGVERHSADLVRAAPAGGDARVNTPPTL